MQSTKKGALTRITILEKAREIFNEKGIGLTIDQLAVEMNLTKSRITNHYPTKDSLFISIIAEYENQLTVYFQSFEWGKSGPDFPALKRLLLGAMEIQFAYRCSMSYSTTIMPTGNELAKKIEATAQGNKTQIRKRLSVMVEMGLLEKRLLEKVEFDIFIAGYLNLLTTWVITFELYQSNQKPTVIMEQYLQAIFRTYIPYLTRKGKTNYQSAGLLI